jgi:hypothetical protein
LKHARTLSILGALAVCSLTLGCGGGTQLRVVPDESSIEKRLGSYLTERGLKVTLANETANDQVLLLDFSKSDQTPEFRIAIDTLISTGEANHVDGRVVIVKLLSHVTVPPERRVDALQVLNAHHFAIWAGCFFIDEKDGELEAQWPINVEAEYGVDPAQVQDAMERLISSWEVLYPKLSPVLGGVPAAPAPAAPVKTARL